MCDATKAKNEIAKSKTDLEKKLGAKVDFLAYPNGDYLLRDVETCKKAGYLAAVTLDPGFNDAGTDVYRLKRISICDNASINQLVVKTSGVWALCKHNLKSMIHAVTIKGPLQKGVMKPSPNL